MFDRALNTPLRSSPPEGFLGKGVLKICSKFTGEHPCRSVISVKLLCNFIEITLQHGCSPVNLLHIFRTSFPKNTAEGLLLTSAIGNTQNLRCSFYKNRSTFFVFLLLKTCILFSLQHQKYFYFPKNSVLIKTTTCLLYTTFAINML